MIKTCGICGKLFETPFSFQLTCSSECRSQQRSRRNANYCKNYKKYVKSPTPKKKKFDSKEYHYLRLQQQAEALKLGISYAQYVAWGEELAQKYKNFLEGGLKSVLYHIDGIPVTITGLDDLNEQEAKNYVDYVKQNVCFLAQDNINSVSVSACDDGMVDVSYQLKGPRFERIRRITGYRATRLYMKSMHAA